MNYFSILPALILVPALAGCGGNGANIGDPQYVQFNDASSTATSDLIGHALDTSAIAITSVDGALNRSDDTLTIAGRSGVMNSVNTGAALNDGGTVSFSPLNGVDYAVRYVSSPIGAAATSGIIGIATLAADVPLSGSADLSGNVVLGLQDGADYYDLTGTSNVTIDFLNANVTATFDDLSGSLQSGLATQTITNLGSFEISGATLNASQYSGGTATLTSGSLSQLSGSATVEFAGGLFGPTVSETGGAFIIDDRGGTGQLLIFGDFLAGQP